jgi:hypothetical protein
MRQEEGACARPYEAEGASAGRGHMPPAQMTQVKVLAAGSKLALVVRVRLQPHTPQTPGRASTITDGGCAPGAAGTFLLSTLSGPGQSHFRVIRGGGQRAAAVASET